ncbi:MAG: IS30 family transposase [Cocleimonas sp.]|jgi:IS30 family transposase
MSKIYKHISPEERAVIMINDQQGVKPAQIARLLGRHRSTITRELSSQPKGQYCATSAAKSYQQKRTLCQKPHKLLNNQRLSDTVNTMIQERQ